jgi:hypothetical protein
MELREVGKPTRRLTVKRRGAAPECVRAAMITVQAPFVGTVSRPRREEVDGAPVARPTSHTVDDSPAGPTSAGALQ